ncbi:RAMP superfamily CRISPR-associated protein [Coleofasciculus sp. FACHB-SPT9]|uniref:RAMP superfamily CRISPR-associated protein n=1 Tax=Cyanophyceae TaxID=3028117 RepID=UPI001683B697|nr:RAMP superfamily CRISPR-associated protein [Coleofasciculus sp. FACHB-SPT9]MBD1889504.1 type III-B CRISPR module RAMP protein Cmr4 [Coleofasciculus sp. FACHB-SPT9]
MYHSAYGVIETLAPVHVGATAGEETGNLNLIFRDQFTQTGMIPGSSIRGRFRADMRPQRQQWLESRLEALGVSVPTPDVQEIEIQTNGTKKTISRLKWLEKQADEKKVKVSNDIDDNYWYGHESVDGHPDGGTTEALVKFEYASLVWLPVFCPGQPVVFVTCPLLLKRYKRIAKIDADVPAPYTAATGLEGRQMEGRGKILFFNLGFIELEHEEDLSDWIPPRADLDKNKLVVVGDNDIAMLHDMALYRQSRVKLLDEMKKVDTERGAFFNTEALPEGSVLVFPIALKRKGWKPFGEQENSSNVYSSELYFGGLESIGFGRCCVSLAGEYQ